jgi:hypothetical protein
MLALGLSAGVVEGLCTHLFEPMGRADAAKVLTSAVGKVSLRAGQPVRLGEALVHAENVTGSDLSGVFVARGSMVASARTGTLDPTGVLILRGGSAQGVGGEPWSVKFGSARLPVGAGERRVELSERSLSSLRDLVERMEAQGQDPTLERLALYKRSVMVFSLPLLGLLGLPLGLRGRQPAAMALAVVLGWWTVLRLSDKAAFVLGAGAAALAPLVVLAGVTGLVWWTWRDR